MAYCADDFLKGLKFRLGDIETQSGTTHSDISPEESVEYIERVFGGYKRLLGVSGFHGRIAEVGPGDNSGVGLLLIADGAGQVDLVDRFYSRRDGSAQADIYRLLMKRHKPVDDLLSGRDPAEGESFPGVRRWYGRDAAAEIHFGHHGETYDFIVSCAVVEHMADPEAALAGMVKALKPGGAMAHVVDLRDHGMFSYNWHELKFLEVPEFLYRRMVASSGRPNRYLLPAYKRILAGLPVQADYRVTSLAGVGGIEPAVPYETLPEAKKKKAIDFVRSVRDGFARGFDAYSDEDLSVTGFALVAKKSPASPLGRTR